ncbi:MAG: hypothetical protein EOO07_01615 [Chitinophagaceae bacterium]|nr:MAG: hypothetical protein EOO07_01615 [Chitinophagaceae bacterium]
MKILKFIVLFFIFAPAVASAQKALYPNFPETFESPDTSAKGHYKKAYVKLKSGDWNLDQAILGALTNHDRFNPSGKQSIRMQQNRSKSGYVEMNFDLPEGASKVTVAYASYYKDAPCVWKLEYSLDQGSTWKQIGEDMHTEAKELKTAEFNMDLKGKVRFRINKLGLGDGRADPSIKNGRLSIDDIAIYKN